MKYCQQISKSMGKFLKDKNYFFCFSPEVMLATFLIEITLAVYVFFRYKMGFFGKIVVSLLVLLAAFQLAEYKICTGYNGIVWSKIGFVVITLLPVLGLHLISFIAKRKHFLTLGYALVTTYILIFIFGNNRNFYFFTSWKLFSNWKFKI